jgi:signal transduction histidine kinase
MGPLEGVRVVELGVWVAGPAAGCVLADWGADVVKIEPPGIGDPARLFQRMLGGDLPFNPPFEMDNRSKRSIGLDLNQIAREFAEEAEEDALRRGVRLELRFCRGEASVRADRNMLRRVLVNLVQNAYDATPPGGKVIVGTRRLLRNIKLWVRDSGDGVQTDAEEQVFEPFFSTPDRGTGLALYLRRVWVLAPDGTVALRSITPPGAPASVLLPRLRADPAGEERSS